MARFTSEFDDSAQYSFLAGRCLDDLALRRALGLARREGVAPHDFLLSNGLVTPQAYVDALAHRLRVAALDPGQLPTRQVTLLDGTAHGPSVIAAIVAEHRGRGRVVALATPEVLDSLEFETVRHHRLNHAIRGLRRLDPSLSAAGPIRLWQLAAMLFVIGLVIGGASVAPAITRVVLLGLVSIPFFLVVLFRVIVLATVIRSGRRRYRHAMRLDSELPTYSVMVPMFRESAVLPDLVDALSGMDYPAAKLDCMLILEAADRETIAVARAMTLPAFMRIIVVPDAQPRTKPKALNYALQLARGDIIAVYDAEDIPDPQQLRKAVQAFDQGDDVVCVQASLAIHNAEASWLTRQFALEYAAQFGGLLPTLARLGLPVPLGGTSNHFRRSFLEAAGGWDPYNVTEDADLGIRIARLGGRIVTIPSLTLEEAPSRLAPWIKQRTRWLKGWMQTYMVHMRHPTRLWRETGTVPFLAFQALMGGILLSSLMHPAFYLWMTWELWTGEFLALPEHRVQQALLYLAGFNLVAGFSSAMATAAISCGRLRRASLMPHVVLMPLYWLLVSCAAWRALIQLGRAPHFWEKTEHAARRTRASQNKAYP